MSIRLNQPTRYDGGKKEEHGIPMRAGMKPGERFVYVHYPQSWEWDRSEKEFLPKPKKVFAHGGVNGVTKGGDLTPAIVTINQKGGVYIDPNDSRLGEFEGYLSYYDTSTGGKWFCDWCQTVKVLSNGQIVWRAIPGQWNAFRRHIAKSGIIAPMGVEVFEKIEAAAVEKRDRILNRLDRNPHLSEKLKAANNHLELMRAAWDKINQAQTIKAKPAKSRKAANPLKG